MMDPEPSGQVNTMLPPKGMNRWWVWAVSKFQPSLLTRMEFHRRQRPGVIAPQTR